MLKSYDIIITMNIENVSILNYLKLKEIKMFEIINVMQNNKVEKRYKIFKNAINYVNKQSKGNIYLIKLTIEKGNQK